MNKEKRAQECKDALDKYLKLATSKELRLQFEHRRDAFEKDYGKPYNLFLKKERVL